MAVHYWSVVYLVLLQYVDFTFALGLHVSVAQGKPLSLAHCLGEAQSSI